MSFLAFEYYICCIDSAQHDYEAERQARENKVNKLEEKCERLKAQQLTTEHQLEQFRSAIMKYKIDDRKLKCVITLEFHPDL